MSGQSAVLYREMVQDSLASPLLSDFVRRQEVTMRWSRAGDEWMIVSDPFLDDWHEQERISVVEKLRGTLKEGGFVYGVFQKETLKGFVSVGAQPLGSRKQYLNLPYLHVSAELRGQGIGRVLFLRAVKWARERGAERLYLSAHSSVESQAFYRAMGCVEAEEYQADLVASEPWDVQMEYRL